MFKNLAFSVLSLSILAATLPAHAAQDFNTTRSNKDKGNYLTRPGSNDPVIGAGVAARGGINDFNSSRSNRERGNLAGQGPTDPVLNNGSAARGAINDFNSSRSNRERGN